MRYSDLPTFYECPACGECEENYSAIPLTQCHNNLCDKMVATHATIKVQTLLDHLSIDLPYGEQLAAVTIAVCCIYGPIELTGGTDHEFTYGPLETEPPEDLSPALDWPKEIEIIVYVEAGKWQCRELYQ